MNHIDILIKKVSGVLDYRFTPLVSEIVLKSSDRSVDLFIYLVIPRKKRGRRKLGMCVRVSMYDAENQEYMGMLAKQIVDSFERQLIEKGIKSLK